MNVAADLERRLEFEQNRLLQENLSRLQAEPANLLFGHADGPVRFGAYWVGGSGKEGEQISLLAGVNHSVSYSSHYRLMAKEA